MESCNGSRSSGPDHCRSKNKGIDGSKVDQGLRDQLVTGSAEVLRNRIKPNDDSLCVYRCILGIGYTTRYHTMVKASECWHSPEHNRIGLVG